MASELGQLLRRLRTTHGWTLAQAAQASGISRVTLNRWEIGKHFPRLPELEALLTALNASPVQRRDALSFLSAPRAQALVREDIARFAQESGLSAMPSGGDLLRAMRLRQGFSLEQVATHLGISTRTLRFWEKAEVWPSVAQLHVLCHYLGAEEPEIIALTCGRFASSVPAEPLTGHSVSSRRHAIGSRIYAGTSLDLDYLLLLTDSWRLAVKQTSERSHLAYIYSQYADTLAARGRFAEARQMSDRALELLPEKSPREAFWLYAGITSARVTVFLGTRPQPQRGIKILKEWLPVAKLPEFRAYILSDIAEYLMLDGGAGNVAEAIRLSEQACELAGQSALHPPHIEQVIRKVDLAGVLLRAGRSAEAIAQLLPLRPEFGGGHHRTNAALLEAEAYLNGGDDSRAGESLKVAQRDIERFQLPHLAPRANELTLHLDGHGGS